MNRCPLLISLPLLCLTMTSLADDTSIYNISDQFHGVARPAQMAELPSLVPGTITEIHIKEGQFVKKGTPLVTLDDRVPRARLAAATVEANLTGALRRAQVDQKLAQSRLNRLRSALHRGAGANFELEEAEGILEQAMAAVEQQQDELKAAEANRQLAEAQLSQYTISAPFDGIVTEIHRKSGAIDPSQVIVTVANLDSLEVEMHLPSRLVGKVQPGQSVALKASAPISNVVNSSVLSVSPIINSASDTFRCLLKIENPQTKLPAGFSVVLDDSESMQRISQARPGR
ncbi:MAG: efflux RND transporter periplasmic adaptor subunit [Planctomycetaceae bacterium]